MIGVVIAGHGSLAEELYETAVFIVGQIDQMIALSIDPGEPVEKLQTQIKKAISSVNTGDGVLVLTDMYGGTPANMTLAFLEDKKVEVITGVNLPMLIKLCQCRTEGQSLAELADTVVEYGRKSINQASAILKR